MPDIKANGEKCGGQVKILREARMLYKLTIAKDGAKDLEPLPFRDFADLGKVEKDVEVLLTDHLLDVLFEDAALTPIF